MGTTAIPGKAVKGKARPSPRAWGLRPWPPWPRARRPGHPHGRGDYDPLEAPKDPDFGPSPRAWGLRGPEALLRPPRRAIPTGVGTTALGYLLWAGPPGHPHVRGDYVHMVVFLPYVHGPSPRAWGLLLRPRVRGEPVRAIPTCVGTTYIWWCFSPTCTGHPHVRGDYALPALLQRLEVGPSPRAWGLHFTRTAKTPPHPPLCVFPGDSAGKLVKLHSLEA
jgi:hypothetical protein